MQCPHACIYCMHTKYYQAISKISKFLLGVNVSWICLSLKRKFWKQMFIYIVCHNNVLKSFLKLHLYCIFTRFFLFLSYFCYDYMNAWSDSWYCLPILLRLRDFFIYDIKMCLRVLRAYG